VRSISGTVQDQIEGTRQTRADQQAWQHSLTTFHPQAILELGTGSGTFSRWLSKRVAWFATIDIEQPEAETPGFRRLSVWDDEPEIIALIRQAPRPFVLFCDDGNKPLEVAKYAPALRIGDVVAVHDLGTEVDPGRDIPSWLTVIHKGSLTGFFRKTRHAPWRERLRGGHV
jgi:hypothetical protein